jgi:transcriptional regulator with XRE-family HTH domain
VRKEVRQTKFGRFVLKFGVNKLAARFGIRPSAVYHWLNGSTTPRHMKVPEILKLAKRTGTPLEFDDINGHFLKFHSGMGD